MKVPTLPRATAFFDGQNLYHAAREAFQYRYPNYDPIALADRVCETRGWLLTQVCFYTGVPPRRRDPFWHDFWIAKLGALGHRNSNKLAVKVFSRPLRYRLVASQTENGELAVFDAGQEKGIDVRIALDVIRQAHARSYDVAVIFSQDQDLAEVATEIRAVAREQQRWIKVASAFPVSRNRRNRRGINGTDWIPISGELYETCLDERDYRSVA